MTAKEKLEMFKEELELIGDNAMRELTEEFLTDIVPDYFWEIPASSSGKYHPSFDQGESGLVRHTKMVVAVAVELMNLDMFYTKGYEDDIIIACLLHDTFKNGVIDCGHTVNYHADIAAGMWEVFTVDKLLPIERTDIYSGIKVHMGQWGKEQYPDRDFEKLIHLADYIASRKFFDKYKAD